MVFIFLNMFVMCFEHYDQSKTFGLLLTYLNYLFLAVFIIEFIMKFLGLNFNYFKSKMNIIDFSILVFSIIGLIFEDFIKNNLSISPTFLRVIRLVRFGRMVHFFKETKELQAILFALTRSFSALFNIGSLLFLIIFIYAVFGMNLFMDVGYSNDILTEEFNFQNIYRSIITLFPLCTSGGWSVLLDSLSRENPPYCNPNITNTSNYFTQGDCGSKVLAIPFLVSFVVVTFFVVINMYVAIILENFGEAKDEVHHDPTIDDFKFYYSIWKIFDRNDSEYIKCEFLTDFVDSLYETSTMSYFLRKKKIKYVSPFRIPLPNKDKLISMDIIICENNLIHCEDILEALTKNYLNSIKYTESCGHLIMEDPNFSKLILCNLKKKRPINYKPIGSTLNIANVNELFKDPVEYSNIVRL
jgi:hypothetical protein